MEKETELKTVRGWFERGWDLMIDDQYEGAIKAFTKAIELEPENAETYIKRAEIYCYIGKKCRRARKAIENFNRAIEDYNKAIKLDPKHDTVCYYCSGAYYNRGKAYKRLRNYQQATEDHDTSMRLERIWLHLRPVQEYLNSQGIE